MFVGMCRKLLFGNFEIDSMTTGLRWKALVDHIKDVKTAFGKLGAGPTQVALYFVEIDSAVR